MGFDIKDQQILGAIASEAAARKDAFASLQTQISGLGTNVAAYSAQVAQVASFLDGGASFNASALVGRLGLTQIQPGFALASDLLTLQAAVAGANTATAASITTLSETIATETSALAQVTTTLSATVTNNNTQTSGNITQQAIVAASATAAVATVQTILSAAWGTTATVFSQATTPTALAVGDIWNNTSNGAIKYWNGTAWTPTLVSPTSISSALATATTTAEAFATGAIATAVSTLSASIGAKSTVFTTTSTPTAIAVGDIWINPSTGVTEYWSGTAWTTTLISNPGTVSTAVAAGVTSAQAFATSAIATNNTTLVASLGLALASSVTTEASARATQTGNLSANYSVTVTAGNIVTGMQLNSASGGGTTSSVIAFEASTFKVSDGTSTFPVFTITGGIVTVSTELDIGTGTNRTQIRTGNISLCGGNITTSGGALAAVMQFGSGTSNIQIGANFTGTSGISFLNSGTIVGSITNAAVATFTSLTCPTNILATLNLGTTGATAPATAAAPGTYQITNVFGGGGGHFMMGTPVGWMTINDTGGTPHLVAYYS